MGHTPYYNYTPIVYMESQHLVSGGGGDMRIANMPKKLERPGPHLLHGDPLAMEEYNRKPSSFLVIPGRKENINPSILTNSSVIFSIFPFPALGNGFPK